MSEKFLSIALIILIAVSAGCGTDLASSATAQTSDNFVVTNGLVVTMAEEKCQYNSRLLWRVPEPLRWFEASRSQTPNPQTARPGESATRARLFSPFG